VGAERPLLGFIMTRDELINQPPCDLNCVPIPLNQMDVRNIRRELLEYAHCCRACPSSRKEFAANGGEDSFSEEDRSLVRSLWDEEMGFTSKTGCKLPRRLIPTVCLEYDCKKYDYAVCFRFQAPYWRIKKISWPTEIGRTPCEITQILDGKEVAGTMQV
jgi:hypothetical protein